MQQFPFSKKARAAGKQPIGYLMAKGVAADMISLAAGLVDYTYDALNRVNPDMFPPPCYECAHL